MCCEASACLFSESQLISWIQALDEVSIVSFHFCLCELYIYFVYIRTITLGYESSYLFLALPNLHSQEFPVSEYIIISCLCLFLPPNGIVNVQVTSLPEQVPKGDKILSPYVAQASFRTWDKVVCKKEMSSFDLSHSKNSPADEMGAQQTWQGSDKAHSRRPIKYVCNYE